MHRGTLLAALTLVLLISAAGVWWFKRSRPVENNQVAEPEPEWTGPVLFEDITAESGIDFTYRNGEESGEHLSILESLGGGAGLIDFDGDGLLDIFLPGGGDFAGPDHKQIIGKPSRLYRNLGGRKFADVTSAAGLDQLANDSPWFYTHGVAVADYDRDGWPDLLVTGWRQVALFRNLPADPADPQKGRRFLDVTQQAGLAGGIDWATSAGFGDLDGDGFPDLYVCQYVDWSWNKHPACTYDGKRPDVCPPRQFSGIRHKLYLNTGMGGFIDVSESAGLKPGGPNESKGLGVLIVDVDGDGKPDIYVANDTVNKFLYLNKSERGKLQFAEAGEISGVAMDSRGSANGSMGLAAGDPLHAGKPSLWVTNYENENHALYLNESTPGKPRFKDRTTSLGIAAIGKQYVGWGTSFFDADLDGLEDLFVANGHAIRYPTGKDASRKQKAVLLLNNEGKFQAASGQLGRYARQAHPGRGVGFGDIDNDGRIDLVISHVNEPVALLHGTGGAGRHWLGVQLIGRDNECTVGAKVTLNTGGSEPNQTRFRTGGGSFASAGDPRLLFGMGSEKKGTITITWPDGAVEKHENLPADQYHRLRRGGSSPKPVSK